MTRPEKVSQAHELNQAEMVSLAEKVSQGRVLGVDLGQRRVGLAISDSGRLVASAFSVLTREASRDEDHANLARRGG